MKCTEVEKMLSAFYDDELADLKRREVEEHILQCQACANSLAQFKELSALAKSSARHVVFDGSDWNSVETALDRRSESEVDVIGKPRTTWKVILVAAAITSILAISSAVLLDVGPHHHAHDHANVTAEFGEYLAHFHVDSSRAQEFILEKYDHHLVAPANAAQHLGYRPAIAVGIPNKFNLEGTYVIDMPCCKCIQSVLTRSDDGTQVILFEHDDEETEVWFGDRPQRTVRCDDKPCSIVDFSARIAGSWKRGGRHLTVIGLRDESELSLFVAWFGDANPNNITRPEEHDHHASSRRQPILTRF